MLTGFLPAVEMTEYYLACIGKEKNIRLIMKLARGGHMYIMTNQRKTTLYVGVSSDLPKRIEQHKTHIRPKAFSTKYNVEWLVYYEHHSTIEEAIAREKQVKKWSRAKKDAIINAINPGWNDLTETLLD